MGAIRSTDNRTEAALRRALHAMGLRFRKYKKGLPGKPDIVFPRERVAIFVDGDYWHGRRLITEGVGALTAHFTAEQQPYWIAKLQRNVERDQTVTTALEAEGWSVLRYWESDVKKDVGQFAQDIYRLILQRRAEAREGNSRRV